VQRHAIALDAAAFEVPGVAALRFAALPLQSKAAPYSPHRDAPVPGDNIGITVTDRRSGKRLFYAPGLAQVTPPVFDAMNNADVVMVDGTFWTNDEMMAMGLSRKTAHDIGHLAQSGPGGMIEWLDRLPRSTRRMLIHVNNTNPILDEDSAARATLERAGIEVCEDGMDLSV
jgi:pyrroloquinoline quinone biosynthesis protein B